MFASPVESAQKTHIRIAYRYLLATMACAVFGAVYEVFSHGVYAYGMLYAFAWPLIGGVLPALLMARGDKPLPAEAARLLWHFGLSALTVGCFFSGALEIYGTASDLTVVYWLAGGACLLLSALTGLFIPAGSGKETVANERDALYT